MKVKLFAKEQEFLKELENDSTDYLVSLAKHKMKITIGLSGGKTPEQFYRRLGRDTNLPWEKLSFVLVDERYVPLEDPRSNYQLLKKTLFSADPARSHLKNFYFFNTELDYHECLEDYEKRVSGMLLNALDLTYLGIGPDGHFASIFPRTNLENFSLVFGTQTEQFEVKERMTVSAEAIMKSKKIIVLLQGTAKKDLIEKIRGSKVSNQFPASILRKHQDLTIYFWE